MLFVNDATENVYGRNVAIGNLEESPCSTALGPCAAPGVCDQDGGNLSQGDNLVPGPC